jgi:hypothetical protein
MSETSALFLSVALESIELPLSLIERLLTVPGIRRVDSDYRPPLNLDVPIFRYRCAADGTVTVIDEPIGARECRSSHGDRRPATRDRTTPA